MHAEGGMVVGFLAETRRRGAEVVILHAEAQRRREYFPLSVDSDPVWFHTETRRRGVAAVMMHAEAQRRREYFPLSVDSDRRWL